MTTRRHAPAALIAAAALILTGGIATAVTSHATTVTQASGSTIVPGQTFYEATDDNIQAILEEAKKRPAIFELSRNNCHACELAKAQLTPWAAKDGGSWFFVEVNRNKAPKARELFGDAQGAPTLVAWNKGAEVKELERFWAYNEKKCAQWVNKFFSLVGITSTGAPPITPPAPGQPKPTQPLPPRPTYPGQPSAPVAPQLRDEGFVVTKDNYNQLLEISKTKPVLMDFWTEECIPCNQVKPILKDAYAKSGGAWQLAFAKIDDNMDLWQSYGKPWAPTIVALRGGAEVARHHGFDVSKSEAFLEWIDIFIKGGVPIQDPISADVKDEDAWYEMRAISQRHPVVLRFDAGIPGSAEQKKLVFDVATADRGKWTMANVDLNTEYGKQLLAETGGGSVADGVVMRVLYHGQIRTDVIGEIKGLSDEKTIREFLAKVTSTHYPEN